MRRFPRRGTPESFGWLRTPAFDEPQHICWEPPSGGKVWLQVGVRLVQMLPSLPPQPDLAAVRR